MFTLDLSVGAVLYLDGKLLLNRTPAQDSTVYSCFGGGFVLGKPLPQMLEATLAGQFGLPVKSGKLLYILERFYQRGKMDVHEIVHYYQVICPDLALSELPDYIRSNGQPDLQPVLLKPAELLTGMLLPEGLRQALVTDAQDDFNVSAKLIIENSLAERCNTASGTFRV
ncbi:hypothetical protein JW859_02400 [bacterium]|nr:hypothetical protein [bacterium]